MPTNPKPAPTDPKPIELAALQVVRLMMPAVSQAGVEMTSQRYREIVADVVDEYQRAGAAGITPTELHVAVRRLLLRIASYGFGDFERGI